MAWVIKYLQNFNRMSGPTDYGPDSGGRVKVTHILIILKGVNNDATLWLKWVSIWNLATRTVCDYYFY